MSESIDWSKAPEGATHASSNGHNGFCFWRESRGRMVEFWGAEIHRVNAFGFIKTRSECIPRPTTPQWSGKGLPPVGTACEACFACDGFESWHKGICIFKGKNPELVDVAVIKCGEIAAMYRTCEYIRPIRTPEQIARNEREAAVNELKREMTPSYDAFAEPLLDVITRLGYRKP